MSPNRSRMTSQTTYYFRDSSLLNFLKLGVDGGICTAPSYSSRSVNNMLVMQTTYLGGAYSTISKELLPYSQLLKNLYNSN